MMMADSPSEERPAEEQDDRRGFLSASSIAMAGGLAAGYGTFFVMAGRYLYPAGDAPKAWMFVTELDAVEPGDSLEFKAPTGEDIVIARQNDLGRKGTNKQTIVSRTLEQQADLVCHIAQQLGQAAGGLIAGQDKVDAHRRPVDDQLGQIVHSVDIHPQGTEVVYDKQ